ncbi:MAG: hypothetical protein J3K34DRAFT_402981 [Monoraphidium minutum]|nr:MAG: hypothetical protein J3K34DRAFT_402981 [Monoraphidium minutum]
MFVAMAAQAAAAAAAGIEGFAGHKLDAARRRGMTGGRVHVDHHVLQRLQLVAWLSSHLSSGAAFVAAGAGDAYALLFRLAYKAVNQMVTPWAAALRDQANRGAAAGSKPAMLARALTLQEHEVASLRLVGAALVLAYAQVYDAVEMAVRDVFHSATAAGQAYVTESYGEELAAVAREGVQIASHLFGLTASWSRLLGRAFISRAAQRRARELVAREAPGVHLEALGGDD